MGAELNGPMCPAGGGITGQGRACHAAIGTKAAGGLPNVGGGAPRYAACFSYRPREAVSTHAFPWTRETPATRSLLWELLTQQARPVVGEAPVH